MISSLIFYVKIAKIVLNTLHTMNRTLILEILELRILYFLIRNLKFLGCKT